jgi:uncharacterized SAM-binding protein YcdF (DUF218 family)
LSRPSRPAVPIHPLLRKRRWLWLFALVLVVALAYEFRTGLLYVIGDVLVVRDAMEPADAIFLLNGDVPARPTQAAELLREHLAPIIVLGRTPKIGGGQYKNMTDFAVDTLKSLGVLDSEIVQLDSTPGVQHTFDEANVLLKYCRLYHVRKVIVVTSELHTRRARFIIRKVLRPASVEVLMEPVPLGPYRANNWWKSEDGVVVCEEEYIKSLYYYLKY